MNVSSWQGFEDLVAAFGERDELPSQRVVSVRQVHGRDVVVCDHMAAGEHPEIRADALVAASAGTFVAVKTADCVPVLLMAPADAGGVPWAAAVHAGWRGTVAGVIDSAVADAVTRGFTLAGLHAAVGPAIGPCCYEVGDDVAASFRRLDLPVIAGGRKPHLDLPESARTLLLRAGLDAAHVNVCAPCTRCNRDRYHSFRAFGEGAGRQLSWVGWRPPRSRGAQ
jgi:YfiH family protein